MRNESRWLNYAAKRAQQKADQRFTAERQRLLGRHRRGSPGYEAGMKKIKDRHAVASEKATRGEGGGCVVIALGILGGAAVTVLRARGLT